MIIGLVLYNTANVHRRLSLRDRIKQLSPRICSIERKVRSFHLILFILSFLTSLISALASVKLGDQSTAIDSKTCIRHFVMYLGSSIPAGLSMTIRLFHLLSMTNLQRIFNSPRFIKKMKDFSFRILDP